MNIQLILNISALAITLAAAYKSSSLKIALPLLGLAGVFIIISFFIGKEKANQKKHLSIIAIVLFVVAANVMIIKAKWSYYFNPMTVSLDVYAPKILSALPSDGIEIISFFRDDNTRKISNTREAITKLSPKIRYKNFDPDIYPDVAERYQVTSYDQSVISYHGRFRHLKKINLATIAAGLSYIVERYKDTEVCFVTGHNESQPYDENNKGFSRFAQMLEEYGVKWNSITLTRISEVRLNQCSVLVIALNGQNFAPEELATLKEFFDSGKNLFIMAGDAAFRDNFHKWLNEVLSASIEPIYLKKKPKSAVIFDGGFLLADQMSSILGPSLEPVLLKSPFIITALVTEDWGKKSVASISSEGIIFVERNKGAINKGEPFPNVAVLMTNRDGRRSVVIGDTTWATNGYIDFVGNASFALESIFWLLGEGKDASFAVSYEITHESELISMKDDDLNFFKRIYVISIPAILFAALFIAWRKL